MGPGCLRCQDFFIVTIFCRESFLAPLPPQPSLFGVLDKDLKINRRQGSLIGAAWMKDAT